MVQRRAGLRLRGSGLGARQVAAEAVACDCLQRRKSLKILNKITPTLANRAADGETIGRWHIGCINEINRRFRLLQVRPY
jgi:hypothetical protein